MDIARHSCFQIHKHWSSIEQVGSDRISIKTIISFSPKIQSALHKLTTTKTREEKQILFLKTALFVKKCMKIYKKNQVYKYDSTAYLEI